MRGMLAGACAIAALFAAGETSRGQERTTVWIHATVLDKTGHVVTGLKQEDFTVTDNGTVRPITVFSREEMPVAISLMLDVSGSMAKMMPHVRRAAETLIDRFIDGDRVNVGTFATNIAYSAQFTANRRRILDAIGLGLTGNGIDCMPPSRPPSKMTGLPRPGGTWMWDAIECGIKALEDDGEAFRRVLVLVTDGKENGGYATGSTAANMAYRTGVLIYAVGLQGLTGRDGPLLRDLTVGTGGGYLPLEEKEDYTPAFTRIADELHGQYVLGFESAPGSSGKLKVTVQTPGLTVRARKGYQVK